jgi:hypothetical protein
LLALDGLETERGGWLLDTRLPYQTSEPYNPICTHVCMYVCVCIYIYMAGIYIYGREYVHKCISARENVCIYMYIYMYICINTYIYIHTYKA